MKPSQEEPIRFDSFLRHYRIAAGLTQEALAERTGLGVRSVSAARAGLGEEAFATAYAEGQVMTLKEAVAYALERDGG